MEIQAENDIGLTNGCNQRTDGGLSLKNTDRTVHTTVCIYTLRKFSHGIYTKYLRININVEGRGRIESRERAGGREEGKKCSLSVTFLEGVPFFITAKTF